MLEHACLLRVFGGLGVSGQTLRLRASVSVRAWPPILINWFPRYCLLWLLWLFLRLSWAVCPSAKGL